MIKSTARSIVAFHCFLGVSYAADLIRLPAMRGDITFPHQKHQAMINSCGECHDEKQQGKINKKSFHRLCLECHETKRRGPDRCNECH